MKKYLFIPLSCFLLPLLIQFIIHHDFGMSEVEFRALDQNELLTLLIALVVIKPLYLLLCLGSIIYLYQRPSRPFRLLFWGLVVFLQGELICGAYYMAFRRELMISEYIHAYGTAFQLGLFTLAALELAGEHFHARSGKMLVITSGMILSFFTLLIPVQAGGYRTELFGIPYGFSRFEFNVWTETRALPWMSLALFILAMITSRVGHKPFSESAKIFLSTGVGLTFFSLWRAILGTLYAQDLVLFEFWEEIIQMTLLSCIAFALWRFHRSTGA